MPRRQLHETLDYRSRSDELGRVLDVNHVHHRMSLDGAHPVPNGGRKQRICPIHSDGLTRRRFAAIEHCALSQHRNRGHPVMFVLVGIVPGYLSRFADLWVTPALWGCGVIPAADAE